MAKSCQMAKLRDRTKLRFQVRHRNRCPICGRPRGYYRKFNMCRICLRNLALRGDLPGVTKASW